LVDLNKAIAETRKSIAMLIGEDIELRFKPSTEPWSVFIDPVQLDQIVMNMAVNARDAMPDGGIFTISTENIRFEDQTSAVHHELGSGEYVALSFSDTGCGMDQETISRIFEPFYTTKEVGKGTGLGLSTIYGIVKQSGGSIGVQSEPGSGTTFEIILPRRHGAARVLFSDEAEYAGMGEGCILLIEDEEGVRKMTSHMLQMLGYKVYEASSAEEAMRLVSQSDIMIDLVLTDLIMPQTNGRVLFDRISLIRPGLKALYMSGHADDILSRESIGELGENFIQKPFGYRQLYEKLNVLLAT
jgi:CheY-like chemotaxis protein